MVTIDGKLQTEDAGAREMINRLRRENRDSYYIAIAAVLVAVISLAVNLAR